MAYERGQDTFKVRVDNSKAGSCYPNMEDRMYQDRNSRLW